MTWQGYPKDVQDKLRANPAIRDAIDNMIKRDYSVEAICRVTGAPYEVVESQMRRAGHQVSTPKTESELREMSEKMAKARKAPRVVKAQDWAPLPKIERTPEEQERFNQRMAKARAGRGKRGDSSSS